ncbi:hypothetical protein HDU96_010697 [Phlyctochytrium bullatum]|nr:hypothetical protein HDU96_010697 [Phlyctochytrium bullatum]
MGPKGRGRANPPGSGANRGRGGGPPPAGRGGPPPAAAAPQRPPTAGDFPGLGAAPAPVAAPAPAPSRAAAPVAAPASVAAAPALLPPTATGAPTPARPVTAAADPVENLAFKLDESLVMFDRVRPQRPGVGQKGKAIKLWANHYGMKVPGSDCFHYDVDISPETSPPINRKLIETWKAATGGDARLACYDGRKNLFTPKRLKLKGPGGDSAQDKVVFVNEEDAEEGAAKRQQSFTITVNLVAVVNMERLTRFIEGKGEQEAPRDAIQVLDVLLKHRPTMLFLSVSRKTGGSFYSDAAPVFISDGLAAHHGWKQSIRPTYRQLLLNLDVSTSCYYQTGPLLKVVASFFNRNSIVDILRDPNLLSRLTNPTSLEFQRLSRFLATVSVEVTHRTTGRRKYKIKRLHKLGAADSEIVVDADPATGTGGRKTTVVKYFKDMFGVVLQYPQLPLLAMGPEGKMLIPMELANVRPGQRHVGKLSDAQTADVIKIAAVPPGERQGRIMEGRRSLHNPETEKFLKDWGVSIDANLKEIDARILPPPVLTGRVPPNAKGNGDIKPLNGAYDFSKISEGFYRGAGLSSYAVVVIGRQRCRTEEVAAFVEDVLATCRSKGMPVERREVGRLVVHYPNQMLPIERLLGEAAEVGKQVCGRPVQMLFCVFDRSTAIYEEVKLLAETKMNIMTQCFQAKHCFKPKPGVTINLALKINVKLGGVNAVAEPSKQLMSLGANVPTMFMGADVTHPPPGIDGGVSIAAVVGSLDAKFCEYRAAIRVQPPRVEIIANLQSVYRELATQFYERHKVYPKRVVFYRDGVSEGQFGEVALREVQALKKAFRDMGCPDVRLTFVIVNKRHGTRFFVKNSQDGDRKGNVMAGTVVDSGITHPFEFDFFLNSHGGLQGTSRAAHYHVLYDENKYGADAMQDITYKMCYLYARATRSVSIVPPAYYAHLVAARARCFRPGGSQSDTMSVGSGGTNRSGGGISAEQFSEVTEHIRRQMYYV